MMMMIIMVVVVVMMTMIVRSDEKQIVTPGYHCKDIFTSENDA